jgi:hypothetical protein
MSQKRYLPGGIILCVVPLLVLWIAHTHGFIVRSETPDESITVGAHHAAHVAHSNGPEVPFPLWGFIFLGVCFFWGVWTVILSIFNLDMQGAAASFVGSILVAGVAAMFFVIAWTAKSGWSGSIPLLPDSLNQMAPRLLFGLGGIVTTIGSASLLRKAIRKCKRGF